MKKEQQVVSKEEKISSFIETENKGYVLEFYVNSNDIESLKTILKLHPEHVDTYNTEYFGETPLFNATETDNYEISKFLLEKGADVDAANFEDNTTPLINSSYNNNIKITQLLLDYDADINKTNKYGDTALHWACRKGYIDIVKLLLDYDADPNIENRFAGINTPLGIAEREGHTEIVSLLKNKINEYNK